MKRPWATAEAALVDMQGQLLQQQAARGLRRGYGVPQKGEHDLQSQTYLIIGHRNDYWTHRT